jgi:GTP pyrophosphokinase
MPPTRRAARAGGARDAGTLYSPLANRLGVWELKWELEDLSFRFLHPESTRKLPKCSTRSAPSASSSSPMRSTACRRELATAGVGNAEVYGRPKHIYSIWNKMRKKDVEFSEVYDVRACASSSMK